MPARACTLLLLTLARLHDLPADVPASTAPGRPRLRSVGAHRGPRGRYGPAAGAALLQLAGMGMLEGPSNPCQG